MAELTKEWLLRTIAELEEERDSMPGVVNEDAAMALAAMKLALASLEAEPGVNHQPVAWQYKEYVHVSGLGYLWREKLDCEFPGAECETLKDVVPLYTAPPAPVSVPDAMEMDDDFDSAFEHGKAVGWNAYRAAMLQGADRPQNEPQNIPENIPATQFKPVADLYGLTSPTGGETSFTFDAVEARDFIDGGWLCQEYVELERFQEAITNHTEDKLAMVDHSGDSNNMVESVTTACELPDDFICMLTGRAKYLREKGEIKSPELLERAAAALQGESVNTPSIPNGWKLVPIDPTKDMLRAGQSVVGFWLNTVHCYSKMLAAAPAAPQQEVKNG